MAASTSPPQAMAMPARDMMLMLTPARDSGMNASKMATGIVTTGMTALGKCQRKTKMIRTTVTITSMTVIRALEIERRMRSERS